MEKVEEILVREYEKENPSNLNELIFPLMETLSIEKQEGEKNLIFEQRLLEGLNKVLGVELWKEEAIAKRESCAQENRRLS